MAHPAAPLTFRPGGSVYVVGTFFLGLGAFLLLMAVLAATGPHGSVRPSILFVPFGAACGYVAATTYRSKVTVSGNTISWTSLRGTRSASSDQVVGFETQSVRGGRSNRARVTIRMYLVGHRDVWLPLSWPNGLAGRAEASRVCAELIRWQRAHPAPAIAPPAYPPPAYPPPAYPPPAYPGYVYRPYPAYPRTGRYVCAEVIAPAAIFLVVVPFFLVAMFSTRSYGIGAFFAAFYTALVIQVARMFFFASVKADGTLVFRGLFRTVRTNVADVLSIRTGTGGLNFSYVFLTRHGDAAFGSVSGRSLGRAVYAMNPSIPVPLSISAP